MNEGPNIKGNPLRISVGLLLASYIIGEFILPKYPLIYFLNLIGVLGLIASVSIFFSGFNIFKTYNEDPNPTSISNKIIKTGIFAYTRNPIYLSFVTFHLSMFLIFENVMYFLSAIAQAIWLHNYVINKEEEYLNMQFSEEYKNYTNTVKRWIFF
tara:strand:- start:722 stop:1186 length:465 start_codon:yes stop_codon:yes gene_type:complete